MTELEAHDTSEGQPMHQQPSRAAIDPQYRWDLTRLFPDEQRWEDEYAQLAAALPGFPALSGSLGATGAQLLHTATARHDRRTNRPPPALCRPAPGRRHDPG